jgi:hypothetical protein
MKVLSMSSVGAALLASAGLSASAAPDANPDVAQPDANSPAVDDAARQADLNVRELPAPTNVKQLKMRSAAPAQPAKKPDAKSSKKKLAQAADDAAGGDDKAAAAPAPDAAPTESTSTSFKPIPTTLRDLRERVSFTINAGLQVDTAADNGSAMRGGAFLTNDFAGTRPWIVGDAVVGARDLIVPSLGAYFLSSFQFDVSDSLATRTATVSPFDASDLALAIKAGYAEYGRDDRKPDASGPWIRAGRQARMDGGALFAYFDGATVGYRTKALSLSAFAGQRVALYVETERGIEYGATATLDLKAMKTAPVKIALDYMGLAIDVLGDGRNRSLFVATGSTELGKKGKLEVFTRFVDSGFKAGMDDPALGLKEGFTLGRAGARFKYNVTNDLLFMADAEERLGGDLAYDLTAPSAADVVQVAQKLGVGLSAPVDATRVGARIDYRKKETEILVFGGTEQASGTPTLTDQRGWVEAGAALAGSPVGSRGAGVWATLQYKYRQFLNGGHVNDQMGSTFGDSSTSGVDQMHEISGDATLRSGGTGMRWRFNGGVFYRIYDFSSPYRDVTNEGRGGGRADLQLWIQRDLRLDVGAELAQASPVLARELGLMSSVRATLEARW